MTNHENSASAVASASTLLPSAKVIPLPTAKRSRAEPRGLHQEYCPQDALPFGAIGNFFWDQSCRGFGLRALSSGRRSWVYQYRDEHGRTRRIVLGDVSAVSLDNARIEARRKAASAAHGANPSVERKKKRAAGTVLEVVEAYLPCARTRQRPRSYKETERNLRVHAGSIFKHHLSELPWRGCCCEIKRVILLFSTKRR
jgi:Arm DNA-binding domain